MAMSKSTATNKPTSGDPREPSKGSRRNNFTVLGGSRSRISGGREGEHEVVGEHNSSPGGARPKHEKLRWGAALFWTLLTTFFGLLGLLIYSLFTLIARNENWDAQATFTSGSILLFSATIASAVALDCYYQARSYSLDVHASAYLGAFIIVLFSVIFYLFVLLMPPDELEFDLLVYFTLVILFVALLYSVSFKSITFQS